MKENKFALEVEKLLLDGGVTINPLVMEITSAYVSAQNSRATLGNTNDPQAFLLEYINSYKRFDGILKCIPNYYEAGMDADIKSKRL